MAPALTAVDGGRPDTAEACRPSTCGKQIGQLLKMERQCASESVLRPPPTPIAFVPLKGEHHRYHRQANPFYTPGVLRRTPTAGKTRDAAMNITIRQRILLSFAAILAAMLVLGGIALQRLSQIEAEENLLRRDSIPGMRIASQVLVAWHAN